MSGGAAASAPMDELRPALEGVVPAIMATVATDGTPNVAYISQVHHVDDHHVALSFQFFNKTRQNLLAHPRSTVLLTHPHTGGFYRLHLRYLRTETAGPVFESMKAQLAGIASHSGMADVFVLRGADIHEVLQIERLPGEPFGETLPVPPPRPGLLAALRRASARLVAAGHLAGLLEATLDALAHEFDIPHAMLLILDHGTQRLYTVASRGYATSGVGSEMALGHGVIGVAARERTPVRINHMTSAYLYNQAMRQGMDGSDGVSTDIPYPGLAAPRSQLAVPLLSAGRVLGVLFVESGQDMRFSYEDEDMLVTLGGQLASAMALMQSCEEGCDEAPPAEPPAAAGGSPMHAHAHTHLRVRRYRSNDSIFINNAYLIKGVAGAILWKLLTEQQRGRHDFTNRELRLDASLRLPDVADNLEARLLLLNRRLAEQCPQLRLHKTARGCFRLEVLGTTELEDSP